MEKEDIIVRNHSMQSRMDAVQCLWEAVLEEKVDSSARPGEKPLDESPFMSVFESEGTVAARALCRAEETIQALIDGYHALPREHAAFAVFDWEYTPTFLHTCIDPETLRVHPDWQDRLVTLVNRRSSGKSVDRRRNGSLLIKNRSG